MPPLHLAAGPRAPHDLRRLDAGDFPLVVQHLVRMSEDDRHLRFGTPYGDTQLWHYATTIDFDRDVALGLFQTGELVGLCHLAIFSEHSHLAGEIGVSVDATHRGRGHGAQLLDAAIAQAASRRVLRVHIHFLRRNRHMRALCERLGARITMEADEGTAEIAVCAPGIAPNVSHPMAA